MRRVGEVAEELLDRLERGVGLVGIAGGKRPVAKAAQLGYDIFAHQRIVFDNQDRFRAAFRNRPALFL